MHKTLALLLCIPFTLNGCAFPKKKSIPRIVKLKPVSFESLKGWKEDHQLEAFKAFAKSCEVFIKQDDELPVSTSTQLGGKIRDWKLPCLELMFNTGANHHEARKFFEKWFTPYQVTDHKDSSSGTFTGYYEIELRGSRKRNHRYKYPIYAPPTNLSTMKGHFSLSHAAINQGSLSGKGLELLWVDNKAKLYFMHIQGSGIVTLNNGEEVRVGYAGQNGFSYKAIGPLFKKYSTGKIESALGMMEWLHKNPTTALEIMEANPSYVFFREVDAEGAIGAQTIPLQAERSIAIDYGLFPYGAPIWLQTMSPGTLNYTSKLYNRLLIAQDTGGAIKGAVRGDIFYGRGKRAEELACYMNKKGQYYIMLPKSVMVPTIYKAS